MAESPSPSPSPRPTSRDTDGNVTKKSAQESQQSSHLLESFTDDAPASTESLDVGRAFGRAKTLIEAKIGGALVVSYSRSEIEELVEHRNYERDCDVGFVEVVGKALIGLGAQAKQFIMGLVSGIEITVAEGEKLWSHAGIVSRAEKQKAVHKLMEWVAEDDAVEFERWMDKRVPLVVIDNINDGSRGLAQIAHFYLEGVLAVQADKKHEKFYIYSSETSVWRQIGDGGVKDRLSYVFEEVLGKMIDRVSVDHAKRCAFVDGDGSGEDDKVFVSRVKSLLEIVRKMRCTNGLAGVLKPLADKCGITDIETRLDTKPHLLGVRNGVIDLRTGFLRPRTKEDMLHRLVDVEYDPGVDTKWFDDVVMSIMADDKDMAGFLQRYLGYCITGENKDEIFTFFTSPGRSGKGLLMGSLSALMGPLYAEMEPAILLDRTTHKSGFAAGVGRRIWSFNELPEKAKLQCDIMKKLSGRDNLPVKAQSRQVFKPRQKCIVSTNHLPDLGTVNAAIDERLLVVRFPVLFKTMSESEVESKFVRHADPNLKQKVEENLPVFLKWLVEGAVRWYSDSSTSFKTLAPPAVEQATKEYIDKYDALVPFLRARCIKGAHLEVYTCDLLEAYNAYHKGSREAISAKDLSDMMRRFRNRYQPGTNMGSKKLNGYRGLSLK